MVKVENVAKQDLGLSKRRKPAAQNVTPAAGKQSDRAKESVSSKDSLQCMQIFGSGHKEVLTPSSIKKKILRSPEASVGRAPAVAPQSEKKVHFKDSTDAPREERKAEQSLRSSADLSKSLQQQQNVSKTFEWLQEYEKRKRRILNTVADDIKTTSEYVTGLRTAFNDSAAGATQPQDKTQFAATVPEPDKELQTKTLYDRGVRYKEEDAKTRVDRMREIKGEIQSLLNKLENTSRSIGSSFQLPPSSPSLKNLVPVLQPLPKPSQEPFDIRPNVPERPAATLLAGTRRAQPQFQSQPAPFTADFQPPFRIPEGTVEEEEDKRNKSPPRPEEGKGEIVMIRKKLEEITTMADAKDGENRRLQNELEQLRREKAESETRLQVEVQSQKLANAELQQKLRGIEEKSDSAELFALYDRDIDRLFLRNEELRTELVACGLRAAPVALDSKDADVREAAFKKTTDSLRRVVKKLEKSLKESESEVEALRKEQRRWKLHEKLLVDSTKRANTMKGDKDRTETLLAQAEERIRLLEFQLDSKSRDNQDLALQVDKAETEAKSMGEELRLLKDFAYDVDLTGLQMHYERYVKAPTMKPGKREIWEDLLEKVKAECGERLRAVCESIQFEGRQMLAELERTKDNQKTLIDVLTRVHSAISVSKEMITAPI